MLDADNIDYSGIEYNEEKNVLELVVHTKSGNLVYLNRIKNPFISDMFQMRVLNFLFQMCTESNEDCVTITNKNISSLSGVFGEVINQDESLRNAAGKCYVSLRNIYDLKDTFGVDKYNRSESYYSIYNALEKLYDELVMSLRQKMSRITVFDKFSFDDLTEVLNKSNTIDDDWFEDDTEEEVKETGKEDIWEGFDAEYGIKE